MFALKTIVLAFVAAASVSAAPVEEASLAKRASGSGPGTYYFRKLAFLTLTRIFI